MLQEQDPKTAELLRQYPTELEQEENKPLPADLTMNQIFELLFKLDNSLIELTEDQMKQLGEMCLQKVDNYKYIEEKYEGEIARIKGRVEHYSSILKNLNSRLASLKEHLMFHVKHNGYDGKLFGDEWVAVVSTIKNSAVEIEKGYDPDQKIAINYPNLVRKKYEWDKTQLKAYLKQNFPTEEGYWYGDKIRLRDVDKLKWSAKTDVHGKPNKKS